MKKSWLLTLHLLPGKTKHIPWKLLLSVSCMQPHYLFWSNNKKDLFPERWWEITRACVQILNSWSKYLAKKQVQREKDRVINESIWEIPHVKESKSNIWLLQCMKNLTDATHCMITKIVDKPKVVSIRQINNQHNHTSSCQVCKNKTTLYHLFIFEP